MLLYAVWRFLLFVLNNPTWIEKIRFRRKASVQAPGISDVARIIRDAQKYSQRIYQQKYGWRRFFVGRHLRDAQPCYLVLGPASAGKTSLILSSGQEFPLPEQLSRAARENPPTASCECFFANDAIFIDTSGKYVTAAEDNRQEWQGLLQAIHKYRPATGINGALITFSASDILSLSQTQRLALAATLRARLDDLRTTLGARFPVYLLVTKVDELTGFDAWFRHLTAQEREQIWGVTFPWGDIRKGKSTPGGDIEQELRLLENRLRNAVSIRHQEEYAVADRKKMYAVPQDFRLLAQGVAELVRPIFFASRYDETQFYSTLRGVYFTSSCQPESVTLRNSTTLVQKWRNYVARADLGSCACLPEPTPEEDRPGADVVWGKRYFLRRLFADIIIRDAGLVRYNLRAQSKYRFQNLLGQERFDLDYLVDSITHAWSENGKITAFEEKEIFTGHLNALFSQPQWRRFGQPRDEDLVRDARKRLAQTTLTTRLWSRLRARLEDDAPPNLTLDQLAGDASAHVFTLDDSTLLASGIPGLYTQAGYHQVVKKKLSLLLTGAFQEDRWVMGNDNGSTINPLILRNDVLGRYLDEYAGYPQRPVAF